MELQGTEEAATQPPPYIAPPQATTMGLEYRPAGRLATAAVIALGVWIAGAVVGVVADVSRLGLIADIHNGLAVTADRAQASDDFVRLAGWLWIGAWVVSALCFLVWLHRIAANNLAFRGVALRFSPGWAVGWWFVPFVNLVRPAQILSENWRATERSAPSIRVPALVLAWWALYLVGNAVVRIANAGTPSDLDGFQLRAQMEIFGAAILIVAAVLAIVLVRRLTARQDGKAVAAQVRFS